MSYTKIIFLDIDGVVLPDRAYHLPTQTKPLVQVFDPCAVALLNKACSERKYKIVLHTSWLRFHPLGWTLQHCIDQGIKKGHFHDGDPECDGTINWRYNRIDDWLSRHPEVKKKYWILDDTPPEDGYPRTPHWIKCDPDEGISMAIYRKLTAEPFLVNKT